MDPFGLNGQDVIAKVRTTVNMYNLLLPVCQCRIRCSIFYFACFDYNRLLRYCNMMNCTRTQDTGSEREYFVQTMEHGLMARVVGSDVMYYQFDAVG